jgi:hypothetical protein
VLVGASKGATICAPRIFKNGAEVTSNYVGTSNGFISAHTTILLDMNGTTDYVEAYGQNSGGTVIDGAIAGTFKAPSSPPTALAVQFNDGGSALGGDADYTWNKTNNVLNITGLISTTNISVTNLHVTSTLRIPSVTTAAAVGPGGNRIASGTTNVTAYNGGSITFTTGGSQKLIIDNGFLFINAPGQEEGGIAGQMGMRYDSTRIAV